MDYAERRAAEIAAERYADLDAARHGGGSRAYDATSASASSPVTTPDLWAKYPKCRECMQRWTCPAVELCWTIDGQGKRVLQDKDGAPVVNV